MNKRVKPIEKLKVLQSFGPKDSKHATNQIIHLYERGAIKTVNQAKSMIGKIIYGQGNTKHKTSEQIATLQRNNPITHHTRITKNHRRKYNHIMFLVRLK